VDGTWTDRLRRVDRRIWDALLAVVVLSASMAGYLLQVGGPRDADADALGAALVVSASVPIAWRRRAPLLVAAIVGASAAAYSFLDHQPALILPLAISLYTAAAYRERDRLVPILLPVAVITAIAMNAADRQIGRQGYNWVEILAEIVVTAGIPIALGRMTFNRRRRVALDRDLAAR
jgi:hypothetical protein